MVKKQVQACPKDKESLMLQPSIAQLLLRIGQLVSSENTYKIRKKVQDRLSEASHEVDPAILETVRSFMGPLENELFQLRGMLAASTENPDYLFQFRKSEVFRNDLTRILHLMKNSRKLIWEELMPNEWIAQKGAEQYFPSHRQVDETMQKIHETQKSLPKEEWMPTEIQARLYLQEGLRHTIIGLAAGQRETGSMSVRMPGLLVGHLGVLAHGIETQTGALFYNPSEEVGMDDRESMQTVLDVSNRCLLALQDYERTKQVIPSLE